MSTKGEDTARLPSSHSSWRLRLPLDPSAKLPVAILIVAAAIGWLAAWEPVWIAAVVLSADLAFFSRDPERSVVDRGDRIGFIRLGSRVELYLPAGSDVVVRPGQRVRGGFSIVGRLPEHAPGPCLPGRVCT